MFKKVISISNAPAPIGAYSQAIWIKDTLYISGQIPLDPFSGELVEGDIEKEATQVMENIGALLKEVKLTFNHIAKCSIFLSDMTHFQAVNAVYASYFTAPFPARECVAVKTLPKNVRVEISAIAVGN